MRPPMRVTTEQNPKIAPLAAVLFGIVVMHLRF